MTEIEAQGGLAAESCRPTYSVRLEYTALMYATVNIEADSPADAGRPACPTGRRRPPPRLRARPRGRRHGYHRHGIRDDGRRVGW